MKILIVDDQSSISFECLWITHNFSKGTIQQNQRGAMASASAPERNLRDTITPLCWAAFFAARGPGCFQLNRFIVYVY